MRRIARYIVAAVAGIALAILCISAIQKLGHSIYPPPPGLDFNDPAAFREFVAGLPAGALLFVLVAYLAGTLAGAWLACTVAQRRQPIFAALVGVVVLSGTVANLIAIPHPVWFMVAAGAGIPALAWLGWRLALRPPQV